MPAGCSSAVAMLPAAIVLLHLLLPLLLLLYGLAPAVIARPQEGTPGTPEPPPVQLPVLACALGLGSPPLPEENSAAVCQHSECGAFLLLIDDELCQGAPDREACAEAKRAVAIAAALTPSDEYTIGWSADPVLHAALGLGYSNTSGAPHQLSVDVCAAPERSKATGHKRG